jgi:hypothetical protein
MDLFTNLFLPRVGKHCPLIFDSELGLNHLRPSKLVELSSPRALTRVLPRLA